MEGLVLRPEVEVVGGDGRTAPDVRALPGQSVSPVDTKGKGVLSRTPDSGRVRAEQEVTSLAGTNSPSVSGPRIDPESSSDEEEIVFKGRRWNQKNSPSSPKASTQPLFKPSALVKSSRFETRRDWMRESTMDVHRPVSKLQNLSSTRGLTTQEIVDSFLRQREVDTKECVCGLGERVGGSNMSVVERVDNLYDSHVVGQRREEDRERGGACESTSPQSGSPSLEGSVRKVHFAPGGSGGMRD